MREKLLKKLLKGAFLGAAAAALSKDKNNTKKEKEGYYLKYQAGDWGSLNINLEKLFAYYKKD